jgi:anthranilate synthase/aminodeoxychorismate synthase-like glutamine amidotransferase
MILLVDHQDSFTHNLAHLLARFDHVEVHDRFALPEKLVKAADFIVLSPGPGSPADYPETLAFAEKMKGKTPILGVCLGFQLLLESEGAKIVRQPQVLHGVETEITTTPGSKTYLGLPSSLRVGRYHSLQVDNESLALLPPSIQITATDLIRKVPVSFEDLKRKLFGLQYHPESFLTSDGNRLIENIRHACLDEIG